MEDGKRDNNRVRRSKSDVKNVVTNYLQKRNYSSIQALNISKKELLTHSLVESEVCRPNSVLYSCYNSDPAVIDQNFGRFINWLRDTINYKNVCHDVEKLVGPFFCHLYLDILRGGHSEKAALFFQSHLPSVDKSKCDHVVQSLIDSFTSNEEGNAQKEEFRSNKYLLYLNPQSILIFKKFVQDNCHVVFLQILQTWFDIQELNDLEDDIIQDIMVPEVSPSNDLKFNKLLQVIKEIKNEPKQIFNVNISYAKHQINCGVIKRACGIAAFSQDNFIYMRPINAYDSLFDIYDNRIVKLTGHSGQIYDMVISNDNNVLVSGSADKNMCIFTLPELELSKICPGHLGPVYCVKVGSNGRYIATGSHDTTARLWNRETGEPLRVLIGHTQAVTSLDFHPNCLYIGTGSADGNIRLWSVENGSPLRLLHGSKSTVYSVAFSPTGQHLASASEDKKVRIWDLVACKVIAEYRGRDYPVTKLTWSKDGKELCAGSVDGVVRVWDVCHIQENLSDSTKLLDPILMHSFNQRLLCIEYSFGTFAALTTQ